MTQTAKHALSHDPTQPGQLGSVVVFLTQGTVPNLYQIHFFIFCVNKGFRFMLVYSCLHYLLFKNEKAFKKTIIKVQCFPRFHDKIIKQDRESGVVSLCWTEIPDQNIIMNLNILAATIRSFKMLIDYILDLTPPFSPCPESLPQKKDEETALKFPLVLAHVVIANTPSKFFCLQLGTNFLSFDWDLLAFSFSNLFLFSSPPPPPSADAPVKKLTLAKANSVRAMLRHEERELASDWLNCTGKPTTCYNTEVSQFDDVKGNWCCDCGTAKQKLSQWLKI